MDSCNDKPGKEYCPDSDEGWSVIHQLEKDICYLYHHLSNYSSLVFDLSHEEFNLPYWRYIHLSHSYPDLAFVREGCLLMTAAMAMDCLCGADCYILSHLGEIQDSLGHFAPENERESELHDAVAFLIGNIREKKASEEEIRKKALWIHTEYVRGYYRKKVRDFEKHPYYRNSM